MSYFSKTSYTANGTIRDFAVPFPFLDRSHVKVYKAGILSTDFTWISNGQIQWPSNLPNGTTVFIKRNTPTDLLVTWRDGASLKSADLNRQAKQLLYICQEAIDVFADAAPVNADVINLVNSVLDAAAANAAIAAGLANLVYATTIGNGSATSFTLSHGMNTADVLVQIRDVATYELIETDVQVKPDKTVVISFPTAPATGAYRVTIMGAH